MAKKSIQPWNGSAGIVVPQATDPTALIPYIKGLKPREEIQIMNALKNKDYDMGIDFLWRRAFAKLRATIATLGMQFVGEMLSRPEITDSSNPDQVLTDYDTIRIAENLAIFDQTGMFRIKQAFDTYSHFTNPSTSEPYGPPEILQIVNATVLYILGQENIDVAVNFSKLRKNLTSEVINTDDDQIKLLIDSPPFFIKTAITVLIASIKTQKGAILEITLANLNLLLPAIWDKLPEQERWEIGKLYRDMSASGETTKKAGVKKALIKVKGFDYVPENLRSNTFKYVAKEVVTVHHGFNNFNLEVAPTMHLASLGTTIPSDALAECIQAYLCVFLGNFYNISWKAAEIAENELKKISIDRWEYYFNKLFPSDDIILEKLTMDKPINRFFLLIENLSKDIWLFNIDLKSVQDLLEAAKKRNQMGVKSNAKILLSNYGKNVQ